MHFEILVEGQTELTALSILLPKILGNYNEVHTWKIHKHRGIGRLPDNPAQKPNPHDMTLLHQLPAKLRAYSKTPDANRQVVVVLDLDDRNQFEFLAQLKSLLTLCSHEFIASFELAIEELEAWYLGDYHALMAFNPKIRTQILNEYIQDSICGTWETLVKADTPEILCISKRGQEVQNKKKEWAKKIPPLMEIDQNKSPSFQHFVKTLLSFANS